MTTTERPAQPGETCDCGQPARTVYRTENFGDVPACGVVHRSGDEESEPAAQRYRPGMADTTSETTGPHVTNGQISDLRTEAGQAGDLEMVAICDRALGGDEAARNECAAVIEAARSTA